MVMCQARLSCRCSMLAAEFSGLNWMTKPSWTAILCYRKASCAMFSLTEMLCLHGRALQVNGSRSLLCCPGRQDADDWLNFMLSQKNLWPTFTTRGVSHRGDFRTDLSQGTAAGCRAQASLDGGQQTALETCWLTGCTQRPPSPDGS